MIFPLAEYKPDLCLLFQHMIGEVINSISFHSQNFPTLNNFMTILRIFKYMNFKVEHNTGKAVCSIGSWADMSRARTMCQVKKLTRAESPGGLSKGKTGKIRTLSQCNLPFPRIYLVMWFYTLTLPV